jgi:protein SCO1/2
VGALLLLLLAALAGWIIITGRLPFSAPTLNGLPVQASGLVPDFTLTASTGERLSLSDLRGKVLLIYFGYTFCPDSCPTTMAELKKVPEALGDRANEAQVLMISIDPERDTPEVLRDYLAHFHPSFIGLTGTPEETQAVAALFDVYVNKHEGTAATGYLVDHTASVLAIDKGGALRLLYPYDTPGEDIASDVRVLVRE